MSLRNPLWAMRAHVTMRPGPHAIRHTALMALLAITAGCASTGNRGEVHQFAPVPRVEVAQSELGPVSTRPVSQILREADQAFRAASDAQARGDKTEAMKQYKSMLAKLQEAELDPSVFYSLRKNLDDMGGEIVRPAIQRGAISGLHASGKYTDIQVPFPLPERVLIEIEEIQQRYPANFQIGLNRAQKYVPYIKQELRKAGLPEELVWICMVESQFAPKIDSPAGAGGMWQFMKPTANRYKLRVDSHVDERYNWQSATHSAIEMLAYLHDFFDGNWALAIGAYNMGEGGMSRAVAANGGMTDFWKLIETPPASDRIKRETKKYYPRFLATMIVANNPERYGFKVTPAAPENMVRIPARGMIALNDLDRTLGLQPGTLASYNPDLIAEVTAPSGDYGIAVPATLRDQMMAALSTVPAVNSVQLARQVTTRDNKPVTSSDGAKVTAGKEKTHRVKRGETLTRIAADHGITTEALMDANPLRSPQSLRVGQTLKIPGSNSEVHRAQLADGRGDHRVERDAAAISATAPKMPSDTHTVVRGDTLHTIAQRYGVTVADIQHWNAMGTKTNLQAGQKLMLASNRTDGAVKAPSSGNGAAATGTHKVEAGEYPAKIARAYGMSLNDFLSLNEMSSDSTIHEGQEVRVKGKAAPTKQKEPEPVIHTVARGETASKIAAKYGVKTEDLLAWNGLSKNSVLRIGQQCKIQKSGAGGNASSDSGSMRLAAEKASKTHVVARGHNPTSIARQYGVRVSDLFEWNGWDNNHVLKVGDRVLILD